MPIDRASSRPSLLVRPSSRASSYTRIFLAKFLVSPFLRLPLRTPHLVAAPSLRPILACSEAIASSSSTSPARISARKARLKAPRRPALLMQSGSANSVSPSLQSQAPRPGPFRSTTSWPAGAQDYSDQCTGALPSAAPDARPDGAWRLPRSFPGAQPRRRPPLRAVALCFARPASARSTVGTSSAVRRVLPRCQEPPCSHASLGRLVSQVDLDSLGRCRPAKSPPILRRTEPRHRRPVAKPSRPTSFCTHSPSAHS